MTIPHGLSGMAQGLCQRAREMSGHTNPFISLSDLELACKGNEDLEYHLKEMVEYSLRYAETVCLFE